jgi:asparagine synthase (glutamine-hydrolysing)
MCGFVGIASKVPLQRVDQLLTMRDTMIHRGPDDAGVFLSHDGRIGLAHRRLAIIDLSPGGHQPMLDESGELCIVFNGEIYNYKELRWELKNKGHSFRSASDTEVILAAYREWGTDCLQRFNGMFAFGLYDSKKRRIFLARDRAGEKPLFYGYGDGRFVFASELKALMADPEQPRQLDLNGFEFYLTYGHIPGSYCILKDIHKLPPAHAMTVNFELHEPRVWQYWQLPPPCNDDTLSMDSMLEELEVLLRDAVKRQLVADVPVGVLLSGGVDSSLVTALAAQTSSMPVRTFTITFPGHGPYNEAPYARIVADHFGTQHTELVAESASVELLPKLARQYDEPMCDSSMVPTYLVSNLIRQHCKVAVGGDGGDELFGGYFNHQWLLYQERLRCFLPPLIRKVIKSCALHLPIGFRGRNGMLAIGGELRDAMATSGLFFDNRTRQRLLNPLHEKRGLVINPETYKAGLCEPERGVPGLGMAADFRMYLPDDILVKVDRASMLNSLELRAPLLDYRVIEFAFGRVPNHFRVTTKERKILLRKLASRLLPQRLDLSRPKRGFSLPLRDWFKGDWGGYIEEVLSEADKHIFDLKMIHALIKGQKHGYNNTERLFALTMFELWRKEYKVSLPN